MDARANLAVRAEIKSYYIFMRETLVRKSIYDQFTTGITQDEIINADASKVSWKAKSKCEDSLLKQR